MSELLKFSDVSLSLRPFTLYFSFQNVAFLALSLHSDPVYASLCPTICPINFYVYILYSIWLFLVMFGETHVTCYSTSFIGPTHYLLTTLFFFIVFNHLICSFHSKVGYDHS